MSARRKKVDDQLTYERLEELLRDVGRLEEPSDTVLGPLDIRDLRTALAELLELRCTLQERALAASIEAALRPNLSPIDVEEPTI
ncbi:MAG: hypothetical protein ACRD3Q_17345 [Terriglobales bacterium]